VGADAGADDELVTWLRIDDHEALDRRVGELTDPEYRGRHALMQLCAREYRETGLFPPEDIVHAVYATPKGPRAVSKRTLQRLRALDMVRSRDEYEDDEIAALGLADEWSSTDTRLRVHNWERYNPPREAPGDLERRVSVYLSQNPEASANEVCKIIGANRASVLAALRRVKGGSTIGTGTGTGTTSEPGRNQYQGGSKGGSGTGSRAGTRPRSRPVPSREVPQAVALDADADELDRTAREQLLAEITPDFEEVG
jgi:hypothetical protein